MSVGESVLPLTLLFILKSKRFPLIYLKRFTSLLRITNILTKSNDLESEGEFISFVKIFCQPFDSFKIVF